MATRSSTDDELSNNSFPIPFGKKILLNTANDKRINIINKKLLNILKTPFLGISINIYPQQ